jgi:hypothetical protein
MHLGLHVLSKETDSRSILIDCPACGKQRMPARARDLRQTILLFYVVPIFYHRPTLVDCACGASLVSRLKAKDLVQAGPDLSNRYLSLRIPPVLKTLVVGGLITWILPIIGTVWLGIAYGWSRRYSGWIRSLAFLLFLLSLLSTGALIVTRP